MSFGLCSLRSSSIHTVSINPPRIPTSQMKLCKPIKVYLLSAYNLHNAMQKASCGGRWQRSKSHSLSSHRVYNLLGEIKKVKQMCQSQETRALQYSSAEIFFHLFLIGG